MTLNPNCNPLVTNGVNLQDLPVIMSQVREAVKLHAQNPSYTSYPTQFNCSHCGNQHALTPEEIRDILFRGPGSVDFAATYNEFLGLINGTPAAAAGSGFTNSVNSGTDTDIAHVINPATVINTPVDPDPVAADIITEVATDDHQIVVETGGS